MANILLVEDDALIGEINRDVLSSASHVVTLSTNGQDALEKIRAGGFDAILMDVVMPDMSGFMVIEKLKKDNPSLVLPKLVFLTNMEKEDDKKHAESLGGVYVVKGNISPDQLLELVQSTNSSESIVHSS